MSGLPENLLHRRQFIDHLSEDVLPAWLDRLLSERASSMIE